MIVIVIKIYYSVIVVIGYILAMHFNSMIIKSVKLNLNGFLYIFRT